MSRAAPVLVPALPVLALLVWWSFDNGGYQPSQWLPGAVLATLLAGVVAATRHGKLRPLTTPLRLALGGLWAYTAWSYLSISWASAPGLALQGSHRTLLFAAVATVCALLPWTARLVRSAAVAMVLGTLVAAIVTLVKLHGDSGADGLFLDARLTYPTGYFNATAAFFTMGGVSAIVLASRRDLWFGLRPLLLATATLCEGLTLMTQSRGWLFTLPIVVVLVLALVP